MGSSRKQNSNRDRKYKIVTILLSIIVIGIGCVNLFLNYPTPRLEIGMFPYEATVYSNVILDRVDDLSSGILPDEPIIGYSVYNFTYQIYNSGKGTAYGVNVSIKGEPLETYKVMSTCVFVDEPLESNLLKIVHDEYRIGLLGSGKSYVFLFLVQVPANGQGKFVLTVSSENAGTQSRIITFSENTATSVYP